MNGMNKLLGKAPYMLAAMLLLAAVSSVSYAQEVTAGSWSANSYYAGSSGSFTGTFYNPHGFQLCTKSIILAFNWGSYNTTIPCLAAQHIENFTINFQVPSGTPPGSHNYTMTWYDQGYLAGNNDTLSTGAIAVLAPASSTSVPSTNTTVITTVPVTTSIAQSSGSGSSNTLLIVAIIVVIIIIVVAAYAMMRKR